MESEVRGQFTSRHLAVFKMLIRMVIYVAVHSVIARGPGLCEWEAAVLELSGPHSWITTSVEIVAFLLPG